MTANIKMYYIDKSVARTVAPLKRSIAAAFPGRFKRDHYARRERRRQARQSTLTKKRQPYKLNSHFGRAYSIRVTSDSVNEKSNKYFKIYTLIEGARQTSGLTRTRRKVNVTGF